MFSFFPSSEETENLWKTITVFGQRYYWRCHQSHQWSGWCWLYQKSNSFFIASLLSHYKIVIRRDVQTVAVCCCDQTCPAEDESVHILRDQRVPEHLIVDLADSQLGMCGGSMSGLLHPGGLIHHILEIKSWFLLICCIFWCCQLTSSSEHRL